jgi:hypothetical protein
MANMLVKKINGKRMKMEQIFKKFYINRIVGKSSIRIADLKKYLQLDI